MNKIKIVSSVIGIVLLCGCASEPVGQSYYAREADRLVPADDPAKPKRLTEKETVS